MGNPTVGFKCTQELKEQLQLEAIKADMTLSQYVNHICEGRTEISPKNNNSLNSVSDLEQQYIEVKHKLYEYEKVWLGPLFDKHKGKKLRVEGPNGDTITQEITEPLDIVILLMEIIEESN